LCTWNLPRQISSNAPSELFSLKTWREDWSNKKGNDGKMEWWSNGRNRRSEIRDQRTGKSTKMPKSQFQMSNECPMSKEPNAIQKICLLEMRAERGAQSAALGQMLCSRGVGDKLAWPYRRWEHSIVISSDALGGALRLCERIRLCWLSCLDHSSLAPFFGHLQPAAL
jgi:hypothetical protein